MIVATPDGGAWLLGDEEPGYFGPRALWRIDPKGGLPRRIALPAGRQPLAIAASPIDGRLWVAGVDFVAVLERDGSLRAAAIPSHDVRTLALVATGEGRAVLLRGGDEILLLGDGGALPAITERFTGDTILVSSVVADGRGGFWGPFHVRDRDGPRVSGYLHRGERGWRAWMPDGRMPDFVRTSPELTVVGATLPALGRDWGPGFVAADGAGGFYFAAGDCYRVSADGSGRPVESARLPAFRPSLAGDSTLFWNDVSLDDSARRLVFLTGGARTTGFPPASQGAEPFLVSQFDGEQIVRQEKLPRFPSWGREAWVRGTVSASGGVSWVAYPGLVLRHDEAGWSLFLSQKMRDRLASARSRDTMETVSDLVPGLLGAMAMVAAGGLAASRMHRQRFLPASGQVLGGTLPGGLLAALMFNAALDYRADFAVLTVMVAGILGTTLGAFGTWGVGPLEGGPRRPGVGLAGALGGALVGNLLAIALTNVGRSQSEPVRAAIVGIAAGLIGSLATFGYQLGGGGPSSR